MVIHYFTLLPFSKELQHQLSGAEVAEVFTQQKSELLLSCRHPGGTAEAALTISIQPKLNYCCLRSTLSRARKNSYDLFQSIIGKAVRDVSVIPYDRTLRFELDAGLTLFVQLFNTAESNVLLVDSGGTIIESFKSNKSLMGTMYARKAPAFDPRVLEDVRLFTELLLNDPSRTISAALEAALPIFGSTYTRELLHRANIEDQRKVGTLQGPDATNLHREAKALLNELHTPQPSIYVRANGVKVLSLVQLSHLTGCARETYTTVNDAIRAFIATSFRRQGFEKKRSDLMKKMRGELGRARRSFDMGTQDLAESRRAEEYEQFGQLLMANLHDIRKGLKEIEVADFSIPGKLHRIALDQTLTPLKNAERYFEKSKRSKAARVEAQKRLRILQTKIAALEKLLLDLDDRATDEQLHEFITRHREELRNMKFINDGSGKEQVPFRVFTVAGGFEVWVGKSSANNDLLTMKYAKPHDLWFHVRGAGGSHTVLKVPGGTENIPREAIRQAAGIAVYYSKMRKAGNVPVAYCERKYVRKPKGAAEGAVMLEREKVIFVQPGLPRQGTP